MQSFPVTRPLSGLRLLDQASRRLDTLLLHIENETRSKMAVNLGDGWFSFHHRSHAYANVGHHKDRDTNLLYAKFANRSI